MRRDEEEKQKVAEKLRNLADYIECMPTDEFQMKCNSGRAFLQHFIQNEWSIEKEVEVVSLKVYVNSRKI